MESNEPEQTRKLFIGGLDYSVTDDSLRKYFEQWGEIVDAIVIKNPITKRSRGFGFITYSQSSMAEQAILNKPHNINGRGVVTKQALSRDDINEPNVTTTVKKIFVFGIKEQPVHDILEYFEKFGNIIYIKIVTDKYSSKRKGYGFIEYDNTDSVEKAIITKSHQVAGGKVDVRKAISRIHPTGYSRGGRGGSGGGDGVHRSSWKINPQYQQWGGYYNRSNGWGRGYGNYGMNGGYGSVGGGGADVYNPNFGRAWQGVPQRWGYNYPLRGNQRGGRWGGSKQYSNNLCSNQSYGLTKSNYTSNTSSKPYGNSGAGYVNPGYAGNGQ